MAGVKKTMRSTQFAADSLQIIDRVNETQEELVITRKNVPIAILSPYDKKVAPIFGYMKHSIDFGEVATTLENEEKSDE